MRLVLISFLAYSIFGWCPNSTWSQVDLTVEKISKQNRNIQILVRNLGTRRSPATKLNIWFQNNDNSFALKNHLLEVPELEVDGKKTFTLKHPDRKNVIHLLVTAKVDPASRIPESNERNNLMQRVFRLTPASRPIPSKPKPRLPDLKISSISKRRDNYEVKVTNYGDSRSTPCILTTWVVDKETLKVTKVDRYVSSINVGGSQTLKVDRVPKAKGNVQVTALVDSRKKIVERNESNNRMEVTLSPAKPATAVADLVVLSIDIDSPTIINAVILNQGKGSTGGRCRVRMELFDKESNRRLFVTAKQLPRLDKSQKHSLKFESKVRLRRSMLIVITPDIDNVIRETNERNNSTLRAY